MTSTLHPIRIEYSHVPWYKAKCNINDVNNDVLIKINLNLFVFFVYFLSLVTEMDATLSVLPSCDGCFVFYINYTANDVKKLLEHINVSDKDLADQAQGRSLYLMGRKQQMKEQKKAHFCLHNFHNLFISRQTVDAQPLRLGAFQEASQLSRLLRRTGFPLQSRKKYFAFKISFSKFY